MNVRKRSGKVVPFDAEFIRRAVTLAAAAAGEHDPDGVDRVTEAVQARLEATGQETVDIERIQDTVEEALFAGFSPFSSRTASSKSFRYMS